MSVVYGTVSDGVRVVLVTCVVATLVLCAIGGLVHGVLVSVCVCVCMHVCVCVCLCVCVCVCVCVCILTLSLFSLLRGSVSHKLVSLCDTISEGSIFHFCRHTQAV